MNYLEVKRFQPSFAFFIMNGIFGIVLATLHSVKNFEFNDYLWLSAIFTIGMIFAAISFYEENNYKKVNNLIKLSLIIYTCLFFYFVNLYPEPLMAIPIQFGILCIAISFSKDKEGLTYAIFTKMALLGFSILLILIAFSGFNFQLIRLFGWEFLSKFRHFLEPALRYVLPFCVFPILMLFQIPKITKPYPELFNSFIKYVLTPILAISFLMLIAYFAKTYMHFGNEKLYTDYKEAASIQTVVFGILLLIVSFFLKELPKHISKSLLVILQIFSALFVIPFFYNKFVLDGVKEFEYFISMLLVIFFVSLFFKTKHIPRILGIVFLIGFFSPINMNSVSTFDQVRRLENLLKEEGMLVNDKIKPLIFSKESREKCKSKYKIQYIIRYLCNKRENDCFKKWFKDTDFDKNKDSTYYSSNYVLQEIGLEPKRVFKNNPL